MRQLQTIFCDDVRQEIGGKLTYVGAYSGSMLVSTFPAVLPKFCVGITTVLDRVPDEHDIVIRVLRDQEIIAERVLSRNELPDAGQARAVPGDNDVAHAINSLLVFMPFEIEAPCTLRVRAIIGNEELRGGGLRILPMPVSGPVQRSSA